MTIENKILRTSKRVIINYSNGSKGCVEDVVSFTENSLKTHSGQVISLKGEYTLTFENMQVIETTIKCIRATFAKPKDHSQRYHVEFFVSAFMDGVFPLSLYDHNCDNLENTGSKLWQLSSEHPEYDYKQYTCLSKAIDDLEENMNFKYPYTIMLDKSLSLDDLTEDMCSVGLLYEDLPISLKEDVTVDVGYKYLGK